MIEIVRVSPLSVGRVLGALYFGFSLVLAVPVGLLSLASGEGPEVLLWLFLPFLYGAVGAVVGTILGFFYNAAASVVGGLQLAVSE